MDRLVNGVQEKPAQGSESRSPGDPLYVMATGGGAYKYFDKIQDRLGVQIYREDEMECLIVGPCYIGFLPLPVIGVVGRIARSCMVVLHCRLGFLHHRNSLRSLYLHRGGSHAFRRGQGQYIPLLGTCPSIFVPWGKEGRSRADANDFSLSISAPVSASSKSPDLSSSSE